MAGFSCLCQLCGKGHEVLSQSVDTGGSEVMYIPSLCCRCKKTIDTKVQDMIEHIKAEVVTMNKDQFFTFLRSVENLMNK